LLATGIRRRRRTAPRAAEAVEELAELVGRYALPGVAKQARCAGLLVDMPGQVIEQLKYTFCRRTWRRLCGIRGGLVSELVHRKSLLSQRLKLGFWNCFCL
jgi:hypothetical protein